MAEGVLFNIAEDILKNLGSTAVGEIASAWGFKGQLEKLKNTINTVKNVLLDAEERQQQNRTIRGWLERLKEVVYEADDLFDEVTTMASRKEVMGGSKLTKEVKTFFSHSNQIACAFSTSHKAKKIRRVLDDIVRDGHQFAFLLRSSEERSVARGPETQSYVDAQKVIGRDDDKKAILSMFDQCQDQHVSVVPIVGIGGLGKTTLAQLIYNDDKVEEVFDLKLWVCVSENFDIKEIIRKILMSATKTNPQNLGLDPLQEQMREQIVGKRYLLVLDDIWDANHENYHHEWLKLSDLLEFGRQGSKILVTTRSWKVAKIMGTVPSPYALEGLPEEESWNLFKKMAFEPEHEDKNPELVNIGKEIVQKCGHVPLAIRVLGSLLHGEDESKWLYFKENGLAHTAKGENGVMNILKLSYDHLQSSLKNCFAYCALFPKDYEFNKETLINLWMAQGFVIPTDESKSLEEAGDDYFKTLSQRGFFQDIRRDGWGSIRTCKMHDLIHDLALKVAGTECKVVKHKEMSFHERIHHVSCDYGLTSIPSNVLKLKLLRTFLLPEQIRDGSILSKSMCHQLLSSCKCLRVLDLHNLGVKSLPSSIGKLIHLRYLNLSRTPIEVLPNSITELQNLQTLNLYLCTRLISLPSDIFKKLTNLRNLDGRGSFVHMPSGIGQLTSLQKLTYLPVHNTRTLAFMRKQTTAKLRDLKNLNNLRGSLLIVFRGVLKDPIHEAKEANLSSKRSLMKLHIRWNSLLDRSEDQEVVLEGLKPHCNLKKLKIEYYGGKMLPSWAVMDNLCSSLPNLVDIALHGFRKCQQLPSFGQLPFLKRLNLTYLPNVEYMESGDALYEVHSSLEEALFFPSLQELTLNHMHNLIGWWKEMGEAVSDGQKAKTVQLPKLQHLSKLHISHSPNLMSMPLCPNLEELELVDVNGTLSVLKMATRSIAGVAVATTSASSPGSYSKLKSLCISNVEELVSLPIECLRHLFSLRIQHSSLLSTSRLGEVFISMRSLYCLEFQQCHNLRSLSGGLEHLKMLVELVIWGCDQLDLSPNEDMEEGMPWKALNNLQSLQLSIRKLVALPNGFQHLTNLRFLHIFGDLELKELPAWISCLSSLEQIVLRHCPKLTSLPEGCRELTGLKKLGIEHCDGLMKRCRRPAGEDWPKIQHIPLIILRD